MCKSNTLISSVIEPKWITSMFTEMTKCCKSEDGIFMHKNGSYDHGLLGCDGMWSDRGVLWKCLYQIHNVTHLNGISFTFIIINTSNLQIWPGCSQYVLLQTSLYVQYTLNYLNMDYLDCRLCTSIFYSFLNLLKAANNNLLSDIDNHESVYVSSPLFP
jgi:hypothetical protein